MAEYSRRYFQLTSDILVEYNYAAENGMDNDKLSITEDLKNSVVTCNLSNMPFYLINEDGNKTNLDSTNFVVPVNRSETKFIKPRTKRGIKSVFSVPSGTPIKIENFNYKTDNNTYYLELDKIRFHFTSRNFIGDYDGLIFQAYVYSKNKTKVGLMSFTLSKTDGVNINEQPMLINQRYYTSYIDVKIPCVYKLLKSYDRGFSTAFGAGDSFVYGTLKKELNIADGNEQLMVNSPIGISLYGIKNELNKEGYTYYSTENITGITIPNKDRFDNIYVNVEEATDGDYFLINTRCSDGISFSEYMYKLDDNLQSYAVLYEVSLVEHYVDYTNEVKQDRTHTEQYIVKVMDDTTGRVDANSLNRTIFYRPICQHGSQCFKFTIEVTLRIMDTATGNQIEKKGTLTYNTPARYGKQMRQLNISKTPPVINVYNKRIDTDVDADTDVIRITNGGGGGPKIETQTHQIASFINTINVMVSIKQIPANMVEFGD